METKLQKRHHAANKEIVKLANILLENNPRSKIAGIVADELGLHINTIINYMHGRTSDGFTTEAIIEELKKLLR